MSTGGLMMVGPVISVGYDDAITKKVWWASCPACPGWTAGADSWSELFALIGEWHSSDDAPHHGWTAITPLRAADTRGDA